MVMSLFLIVIIKGYYSTSSPGPMFTSYRLTCVPKKSLLFKKTKVEKKLHKTQ
jgi:hypothetical protein